MEAKVKMRTSSIDAEMIEVMDENEKILWCVVHEDLFYTHGDPVFDELKDGSTVLVTLKATTITP